MEGAAPSGSTTDGLWRAPLPLDQLLMGCGGRRSLWINYCWVVEGAAPSGSTTDGLWRAPLPLDQLLLGCGGRRSLWINY